MDGTSIDLKKFKKVSSDEHSTTIEHEDGHQIILKHDKLKPEHHEALDTKYDDKKSNAPDKGGKKHPDKIKMADGGSVPDSLNPNSDYDPSTDPGMMAAGADTLSANPLTPMQSNYNQQIASQVMNPGGSGFDADQISSRMFSPDHTPDSIDHNAVAKASAQVESKEAKAGAAKVASAEYMAKQNEDRAALGLPPLQMPPGSQADFAPTPVETAAIQAKGSEGLAQGAGQQAYDPRTDPQGMFWSGYNKTMAGIGAEASAQGDLGKQQAQVLAQAADSKQMAIDHYNDQYQKIDQDIQHSMADVRNGFIDPNQYWTGDKNGNGGHSKIAAGIGMILSGFSPIAGAPNAAMEYMNKQMAMNIDAQKANLGAKENLLAANFKRFGNLQDATQMTNIMQQQMVAQQLQQKAAEAASPLAKAAALKAAGQFQAQAAGQAQTFAMQRAMVQMANGQGGAPAGSPQSDQATQHMLGYMRAYAPEKAKEMEARYVPGVGVGSVPVPEAARNKIIAQQDVDRGLTQALDFAKKNAGSMDPRVRAQGATMMNELQSKIRTAEGQGVYKESEAEFMRATMGDNPASFMANITTTPRLKEILSLKRAENATMLKSYGLPVPDRAASLPPAAQKDIAKARKNPGDPISQLVLKHYEIEN